MRFLFVHQNFPGQFRHLAPALVRQGHQVLALSPQGTAVQSWEGVLVLPYAFTQRSTPQVHPWARDFETKAIRAEGCFRAALQLREQGFAPDVIVAHPGWGESLFLKDVWPAARLGVYCEFFYQAQGADTGFDPEFAAVDAAQACRLRLKNAHLLLQWETADGGISPTRWQAATFPPSWRERISVMHDGIDTAAIAPHPGVRVRLDNGLELDRRNEVVTFVSRNLEPYRGYHVFMRALPELLRRRPRARVLIVGGDGVSYGGLPPGDSASWKQRFIDEVRPHIPQADWARVHFLGHVPRAHFTALLQLSAVHVYLTYPFVLSWSLLEAMSAGCAIVASDTAPVREAIEHGHTGRLVDFFDAAGLAAQVCALLADAPERQRLGANARAQALARYDLRTVCLPGQLAWVRGLADGGGGGGG